MPNILNKIFSIQDYNETHKILYLCGIKLKFPKREYAKKRSQNPYYYYKKNNIDITQLPPAEGQTRDIQLANLAVLKELDYVCKKNGLNYWLDFGSVLGAIRHKGFIPWDDDIDTGMMREDYDKIIELFNRDTRNPDIYAQYYREDKRPYIVIIKIKHKKCKHLFVDIFPYEFCNIDLTETEIKNFKQTFKNAEKQAKSLCSTNTDIQTTIKILDENREKYIFKNKQKTDKNRIIYGDFNHTTGSFIYNSGDFFPLKTVNFEGIDFPAQNECELILKDIYGDYMAYPKKVGFGHSMFIKLSEEEKNVIKELAGTNG